MWLVIPYPKMGIVSLRGRHDANSRGPILDSWGEFGIITWEAIAKYASGQKAENCMLLFLLDCINRASQKTDSGFNFAQLIADCAAFAALVMLSYYQLAEGWSQPPTVRPPKLALNDPIIRVDDDIRLVLNQYADELVVAVPEQRICGAGWTISPHGRVASMNSAGIMRDSAARESRYFAR